MKETDLLSRKYHILLALSAEPMHGLKIQQQIVADTLGTYVQGSTIYSALKGMSKQGLVRELEGYPVTYALTGKGRRYLEVETRSLRVALGEAKLRLGL